MIFYGCLTIWLSLVAIGLYDEYRHHGEFRKGKRNWKTLAAGIAVTGLLIMGMVWG